MMIHPADAMLLATTRHRELVGAADAFRAATRATGRTGSPEDCRIPPVGPAPRACRPTPRRRSPARTLRTRLVWHRKARTLR